jgi:hypothetical protein
LSRARVAAFEQPGDERAPRRERREPMNFVAAQLLQAKSVGNRNPRQFVEQAAFADAGIADDRDGARLRRQFRAQSGKHVLAAHKRSFADARELVAEVLMKVD